jgi:hypothetical protein
MYNYLSNSGLEYTKENRRALEKYNKILIKLNTNKGSSPEVIANNRFRALKIFYTNGSYKDLLRLKNTFEIFFGHWRISCDEDDFISIIVYIKEILRRLNKSLLCKLPFDYYGYSSPRFK